jgi:hypothetical protein
MLCFINATKFCSGAAVRWKDNVQGVLKEITNEYWWMLCFINVMKFCPGAAVRWKDNVQGVLKKNNKRILVLS